MANQHPFQPLNAQALKAARVAFDVARNIGIAPIASFIVEGILQGKKPEEIINSPGIKKVENAAIYNADSQKPLPVLKRVCPDGVKACGKPKRRISGGQEGLWTLLSNAFIAPNDEPSHKSPYDDIFKYRAEPMSAYNITRPRVSTGMSPNPHYKAPKAQSVRNATTLNVTSARRYNPTRVSQKVTVRKERSPPSPHRVPGYNKRKNRKGQGSGKRKSSKRRR